MPLLVMHQTLGQLGDLASAIRINAANRLIPRTGEPDASTYAKDDDRVRFVAEDIKGMATLHDQYAVTLGPNREQLVCSLHPNSWPEECTECTEQLATLPAEEWAELLERWEQVRRFYRRYILDRPGVTPDQIARQAWLTNLKASGGAVIEEVLMLRQDLARAAQAGVITPNQPLAGEVGEGVAIHRDFPLAPLPAVVLANSVMASGFAVSDRRRAIMPP